MLVTQADARRIIKEAYGDNFKFRLTTSCTIGVRPVWQVNLNMHTLAWRKLHADKKGDLPSAVYIGRLMNNGTIDWDYTFEEFNSRTVK